MESLKFEILADEQGRITALEIGGVLTLENAQQLKKEFVGVLNRLSDDLKVTIKNVEEIDLSCIQLIMAFIRHLNEFNVDCQLELNLEDEQKLLLENVGLKNELFMTN